MKRFLINIVAMSFAMTLWSPSIAVAQTGYTWTDISGQLSERQNRPIWAVARAGNYWFYTDGQDLWNGGQAYRYDGSTQVNITTDVRNAGLTRIDDMVSDGQSVLFLKNVVARNNSFEILKWNGSGYIGVGSYVRNSFASDEGISSLSGRNGTWYIVSTKGRVFNWNGDRTNATQVSLPTNLQSNVSNVFRNEATNGYGNSFGYKSGIFHVVPISGNNWLFAFAKDYYQISMPNTVVTQVYRYNGSSFSDISTQFTASNSFNVVSNGEEAILVNHCAVCVRTYGHNTARTYSFVNGTGIRTYTSNIDLFGKAIWTGSSWMFLGGENKHIIRVVENSATDLGATRDYLVDGASNNQGTILIGGALSDFNINQPTLPLTAKLLRVTEGELSTNVTTGGSYGGDRTYTSANGPRLVIQGDPSGFRVGNGKDFTYRVTASDNDGIDRTDMYVNDARIKTCNSDVCEFRTAYWTNGATTKTVKFWVRTTDKRGYSTDTSASPDILTVDVNSTASAGGVVVPIPTYVAPTPSTPTTLNTTANTNKVATWTWFDPSGEVKRDAFTTFRTGAWAEDGLSSIELYVNSSLKRTCSFSRAYGNQECSVSVSGNESAVGAQVSAYVKATDVNGKSSWSDVKTVNVVSTNSTSGSSFTGINNNPVVWDWIEIGKDFITVDENARYVAGAWDENGVKNIVIYVNGTQKTNCDLGAANGNQLCTYDIRGSDIPVGSSVFVNAKVTDASGKESWTTGKTVRVMGTGTTTATDYAKNGSVQTWTDRAVYSSTNMITVNGSASDEDLVNRIEILVNGIVVKTCYTSNVRSATCAVTVGPYPNLSSVKYAVSMFDRYGNMTSSGYLNVAIVK